MGSACQKDAASDVSYDANSSISNTQRLSLSSNDGHALTKHVTAMRFTSLKSPTRAINLPPFVPFPRAPVVEENNPAPAVCHEQPGGGACEPEANSSVNTQQSILTATPMASSTVGHFDQSEIPFLMSSSSSSSSLEEDV